MYKNYIKTALRNLWKFKAYSLINISGLSIGLACVILILLYVQSELSFDTFHENKGQIYRLSVQTTNPQTGVIRERAIGPYRLADELKVDFPDFSNVIRFMPQNGERVKYQDEIFSEEKFAFVDPEVFEVFNFSLVEGDPMTALDPPYSVVISERTAIKYFGSQKALGKALEIRGELFEVTGLMANIPENSQFEYEVFASMNASKSLFNQNILENWGEGTVSTYVMLPKGTSSSNYDGRLATFVSNKMRRMEQFSPEVKMQPLSKMYLHSKDIDAYESGGDIVYVYAFSLIAIFILAIACINYINLATARSSVRAKEVGVRKVTGATRLQLITQFLSESSVLIFLAAILALGIVFMTLPSFNQLADRQIVFNLRENGGPIMLLFGLIFITGLLAGSYPAILLSSLQPIAVFSGKLKQGLKGGALRKVLVSFQFTTSIFLLAVTGIVYQQLQYVKNKDLGFDKDQLIILPGTPSGLRSQYDQFTEQVLSNPSIISASASSRVPPGRLGSSMGTRPEGIAEENQPDMQTVWTDFDFIETMGFEMAAGRSFSRDFADANNAFILNEAAVKEIGWTNESALGKSFGSLEVRDWNTGNWEEKDGFVIGVLKDFHFESMKKKIVPTVYFIAPKMAWNYVMKVRPDNINRTLSHIEGVWKEFLPEVPFEYSFVDQHFETLYNTEERQGRIFGLFATLAIFIACLGLIGLASFVAERKKKEIGIRKVLGASKASILTLLSKEFSLLIFIAFILASPLSWLVMNTWLQDFAYRISIGMGIFVAAGLIAFFIAWTTIGLQTLRVINMNPVDSLRNE